MARLAIYASVRRFLFSGMAAVVLQGCGIGGSLLAPIHGDPAVQVSVRTDPPGAKIVVDGRDLGVSPTTFRDPSGEKKTFSIEIRKDGYEPVVRTLTRQWDSMRLTYRLDPVYFYNLTSLAGERESVSVATKAETALPQESPLRVSDVDAIPEMRKWSRDRDVVALVIGISKYREESIPEVRYARRDAETMASYLQAVSGIPRSKIKVLADQGATLSDLTAYVEEWLPRQVSEETTVLIYYAGHGTPNIAAGKAFLVPYDGHPDFSTKLYPLDRLYDSLDRLPTKDVLVLLDSCFSGASGRSVLPKGARPVGISIESQKVSSKKLAVISAASGSEISSDYDKERHGLFTYFVLKGMRGEADVDDNGVVDLEELYRFVKKKVPSVASEEMNRDQTPTLQPALEQLGRLGKVRVSLSGK